MIPPLSLALLFDKLFPNPPTPDEDNSIHQNIYSVAVEVTVGTRMSCISPVSRGEDNGSDNEDNKAELLLA